MSLISIANAQDATGAMADGGIANFIPLVIIFLIFYFLIIRPQQKRLKAHADMINAVKRGDKILTGGGIIAEVTKVDEQNKTADVEIASGVKVKINISTIADVLTKTVTNDNKK